MRSNRYEKIIHQLQEENRFKENLLSISRAVSNIQDRNHLLKMIYERIRQVFPFDSYGLFVLDDSGKYHCELISSEINVKDQVQAKIDEVFGVNAFYEHVGSTVEKAMKEGPGIYLVRDLKHPHVKYMIEGGLKQLIGGPLKFGGKSIGMICFNSQQEDFYSEKDIPLFQAIADQMAIAVSNILTNEALQKRDREKSLQIAITNAIAEEIQNETAVTWEDKFFKVAKILSQHIAFVHFSLVFQFTDGSEPRFNYHYNASGVLEKMPLQDFLTEARLDKAEHRSLFHQINPVLKSGGIYNGEDLKVLQMKYNLFRLCGAAYGFRSAMFFPMTIREKASIVLSFYSKDAQGFTNANYKLLEQLKGQFQLSVQNLLAFQQIERLNQQLTREKQYLQEEVNTAYDFANMIGQTRVMQDVFHRIRQVAKRETTVLILGETGTGKELIARILHDASDRRKKPLVKLNCAALPENLIESELFGHEKGAFTGAIKKRIGKFELAHQGTIFLDEIGELPLPVQAKLLRVIQEKEFEPLGSNQTIRSDFRLLVATNRNLLEEVQKGTFRMDLYYRLNTFTIMLPSLRQRVEDIPLLIDHYGKLFAKKLGYRYQGIADTSLKRLLSYSWPGNVRELQNLIEQAFLTQGSRQLHIEPSTPPLSSFGNANLPQSYLPIEEAEIDDITLADIDRKKEDLERAYLKAVMEKMKWRLSGRKGAAALLDVKHTTLNYCLQKLGLARD